MLERRRRDDPFVGVPGARLRQAQEFAVKPRLGLQKAILRQPCIEEAVARRIVAGAAACTADASDVIDSIMTPPPELLRSLPLLHALSHSAAQASATRIEAFIGVLVWSSSASSIALRGLAPYCAASAVQKGAIGGVLRAMKRMKSAAQPACPIHDL